MLTTIANRHHSRLPKVGEIGYLTNGENRYGQTLYFQGKRERVIVESYPANDNAFGIGIHTAHFRYLGNGERVRVSGFYFQES